MFSCEDRNGVRLRVSLRRSAGSARIKWKIN